MAPPDPSTHRTAEADIVDAMPGAAVRRSADPAVTAAFLKFHREHITGTQLLDSGRELLGSGSWVFAALAIVGLGGGLLLASMSYTTGSESSSIVKARPPEMIYLPPETGAESATAAPDAATAPVPSAEDARIAGTDGDMPAARELAEAERADGGSDLANLNGWNVALSSDPAAFRNATANFDVAMRYSAAGYMLGTGSGEGTESGYGAIELPSVPEPSTGAVVCLGLALLVGVTHLKKRRI